MNLQSTKSTNTTPVAPPYPPFAYEDINSPQDVNNKPSGNIMCMIIETNTLISKSYSNQTGCFPVRSSQGNDYIFICYHYDTNSISALPLRNRKKETITAAWKQVIASLKKHRHAPNLHILDINCSYNLRQAFKDEDITFQLVPPPRAQTQRC